MKILDRIKNLFGFNRAPGRAPYYVALNIPSKDGGHPIFRCTKNVALTVPAFFSGVRIISNTISSLSVKLIDENTNIEARNHPASRLVRMPNAQDTLFDLLQMVICDLVLHGVAYVVIDRNAGGVAVSLAYFPFENVNEPTSEGGAYRITGTDKLVAEYAQRDVIPFRNNFFDYSSLTYYKDAIEIAVLLIRNNINFFKNSARPGLIFKYPDNYELTDEQRREHVQSIVDTYAGDGGAFMPIVADRGVEIDSFDINFQNAQVIEQREFIVKEIARLLQIPPSKMGILGQTKASVSEENNHFVHHTLRPIARIIETKLDKYLLSPQGRQRYRFAFDFNELLYGTLRDRASAFRVNADMGIFSKEEMRKHIYGLPAMIAEGEEVALPPNAQSEMLGENPEGEGGDDDDESMEEDEE